MNENEINLGIGFVTGRDNVCKIINKYYINILEQINRYEKNVHLTFFILSKLVKIFSKTLISVSVFPIF